MGNDISYKVLKPHPTSVKAGKFHSHSFDVVSGPQQKYTGMEILSIFSLFI